MAYKLFIDKSTLFECKLELDGASLNETIARLIVDGPDCQLMFTGKINKEGVCEIPVGKLRGLLDESASGMMRLEVIAEDTYFQPWESEYSVGLSKKLTVEVKQQYENKPLLKTEVKTPAQRITNEIVTDLRKKGVSLNTATTHKSIIKDSIMEHLNRINYQGDRSIILSEVVKLLAK